MTHDASLGHPPYHYRTGQTCDQSLLVQLMHQAYRELCPTASLNHLDQTVKQLWSNPSHLWLVESTQPPLLKQVSGSVVGGLWLGNAIDQMNGDRYAHIFLLYVTPEHRRQGLGTMLMQQAEAWAIQQGCPQIGLHVMVNSHAAQALYQRLGYIAQATFLQKPLRGMV